MRKMRIRNQFLIVMIISSICYMGLVQGFTYFYSSGIIKDKLITLSNENIAQVSSRMDTIIEDMIIASNAIALDENILGALINEDMSSFEKIKQIQPTLQNIDAANLYPYTVEITLLDFIGGIISTGDAFHLNYNEITQEQWYKNAIESKGYFSWIGPTQNYFNEYTEGNGFTMVRLIRKDFYKPCGVLVLHMYNEKKVKKLLSYDDHLEGSSRYILNAKGEVILSSHMEDTAFNIAKAFNEEQLKEGTQQITQGEEDYFITCQPIKKTDWILVQSVPYTTLMGESITFKNFFIMINILFLILLIVIASYLSSRLTKSHRKLCLLMASVEQGDFSVRSNIQGSYEIDGLSHSFNTMIDRINELIEDIKIESELRQKMKLEALQAQINPHFLMNTLNGIKWLCIIENAKTAEKMLIDLGVILEGSMGKYSEFITIEEEIKCLESYLRLQKMRYGHIFKVNFDVEEACLPVKIPVLLLQPIVENCIIHGFEDIDYEGRIDISIHKQDDDIIIKVLDNGIGFKGIDRNRNREGKGYSSIGIGNVRERIHLYYDEPQGLKIKALEDGGTLVTLKIKEHISGVFYDETRLKGGDDH